MRSYRCHYAIGLSFYFLVRSPLRRTGTGTRRKRVVGWRLPPNYHQITRATLCLCDSNPIWGPCCMIWIWIWIWMRMRMRMRMKKSLETGTHKTMQTYS
jgi:hypothetical protein